jgi:alkylation response protein AidB-like acyl-CoA dehydrogenase
MQRVLESSIDYAQTRYQFGRPIGSFQAIKHKAADMLIDFESARTVTAAAVDAIAESQGSDASTASDAVDTSDASETSETSDAELLVAVAHAHTGPAYVRMATENLQIHGGVGYTWEYDAHLYYRRAQANSIFLGDACEAHDRIARHLAASIGGVVAS